MTTNPVGQAFAAVQNIANISIADKRRGIQFLRHLAHYLETADSQELRRTIPTFRQLFTGGIGQFGFLRLIGHADTRAVYVAHQELLHVVAQAVAPYCIAVLSTDNIGRVRPDITETI